MKINMQERKELNLKAREKLSDLVSKLRDRKEAEFFLKDIFSSSELKDISRRILAAELLYHGLTYEEIYFRTGITPSTTNKIHFKTKGSKILPNLWQRSKIKYKFLIDLSNKKIPEISNYIVNRLRKGK